jgi:uncharacterized protein
MDTLEKVLDRTIFVTVAGSRLYGTNIESSDYDFKGVAIASKDYYLGYLKHFEQLERKVQNGAPHDLTITALWKFVNLATDCNPNIVELLYADDSQVFHIDRFGEELVGIRERFITKKARHTFSGYAHGQLKRIKSHRAWLLNPPKEKPTRKQYGLSETSKVSKSELGAFDKLVEGGKEIEMTKEVLTLFVREKQYAAAKENWDKYENWKRTRNEARSELEAQFGYDTKHAMHLVRLMRMCKEILSSGQVLVRRPDAMELLDIRRGAWSYDQLIEHAETLDKECGVLYETSSLAYEPDRVWLDEWLVDITDRYLSR